MPGHKNDTWPYPIEGHKISIAVPVSSYNFIQGLVLSNLIVSPRRVGASAARSGMIF